MLTNYFTASSLFFYGLKMGRQKTSLNCFANRFIADCTESEGNITELAMIDTQNDSIQSLNFGKIGFNSILVSQNSIQTIIQFKKNCGDSIQYIIQFNSHGTIDTS